MEDYLSTNDSDELRGSQNHFPPHIWSDFLEMYVAIASEQTVTGMNRQMDDTHNQIS